MIELTADQRKAMAAETAPYRIHDPETRQTYFLVKEEDFERMRKILDSFARSAGWDDRELDSYEQYRTKP